MMAKECMTKQVEIGRPNMSLYEAASKMRDGNFGVLPIGENDRLIGMVTDRDIAVRGVAEGKDPKQVQVAEVMSKSVRYCYEDEDVNEVIKNLGQNQIRRLPVLNRQKRLVGILSLGNLSQSNANPKNIGETLSQISKNR